MLSSPAPCFVAAADAVSAAIHAKADAIVSRYLPREGIWLLPMRADDLRAELGLFGQECANVSREEFAKAAGRYPR